MEPSASLRTGLMIISLHVCSYQPLALFGMEYHHNPVANAVTAVLAMVWMTLPFACIYGAALGFRSARHHGWSLLPALGVLVNSLYVLVGLFLLLLLATGVRV